MSFQFAVGLGKNADASVALNDAVDQIDSSINWDLVLVWWTTTVNNCESIASELAGKLSAGIVAGCSAESLVAGHQEIEIEPAVCVWCAKLPGVTITAAHIEFQSSAEGGIMAGWPDSLAGDWPDHSFLLTLADPFSFPMDWMIERFNNDRPGIPILGGMASGASQPGESMLLLNDEIWNQGATVLHFSGDIRLKTVVSQGCRPIGDPMVVTQAQLNELQGLGGKPALEQLQALFSTLSTSEQRAVNQGLFIGRVVDEYQQNRTQGDFLIRNVMGIDPNSHAIVVADRLRVGATIQFHIRDSEISDAEMRQQLKKVVLPMQTNCGALLFTCNGRGTRLFKSENHDAALITDTFQGIALAGFFAGGEIGPIGNQNFMHGYTASLAILVPTN
jgi:small ligand-binding sensory domain FIST